MDERVLKLLNDGKAHTLFVLKGFCIKDYGGKVANLKDVIENKLSYLMYLVRQERQVISFDEFVCLYDLLILQYGKICIIENPAYINWYPAGVNIDQEVSQSLLKHFDDDIDIETEIVEIGEYTQVYSNYIQTDSGIACCYNINEVQLRTEKIERISIGNQACTLKEINEIGDNIEFLNFCDDKDYFCLVRRLYNEKKIFAVSWESHQIGKEIALKRLEILNGQFPGRICAYIAPDNVVSDVSNPEILEVLKKHWGYSNFRNIKMYDFGELEKRRKVVVSISQEKIINDIVQQVENCITKKSFKDLFVTAPTGAGKSVMFQIPAIYLAEKYNLLTLVITPLIGLMNNQVQSLERKGYMGARTINSDISPIVKQEILQEVAEGQCHILYLSPESLLSRSDIQQLIGSRRIGMLVVDEAHIVTTWGKQFRPDYWYLGDHVQKLRRTQARQDINPHPFIIATFTATAIYEGLEDMYHETLNSLHMIDPISYLGYVKRENISIEISEVEVKRNKTEYELNKFDSLISMIRKALVREQKVLIYFPTVALITRFYDYCYSKNLKEYVAKYHGQMEADEKNESFREFLDGKKMIMLATKAFGMGIDIPDIAIVSHFAPTGNVCDYMQEIGRAARDSRIQGHAIYQHMSNDFGHINRLHGLSAIQPYQLIEVIKKVLEIYTNTRYSNRRRVNTKKRNEMLVDTESFAYIFEGPTADDSNLLNKVKTAMLLIQKDYENRGFAPFYVRPIPLFAYGYFSIDSKTQMSLERKYRDTVKVVYSPLNVCEVNLKKIWDISYSQRMSFPKFKYLLYLKKEELEFNHQYNLKSAMSVEVYLNDNEEVIFHSVVNALKEVTHVSLIQGKYMSMEEMIEIVSVNAKVSYYRAETILGVALAAMEVYRRDYSGRMNNYMYQVKLTHDRKKSYQFSTASRDFFVWLSRGYKMIKNNTVENNMYVVNQENDHQCKEVITILGVLESSGILRFKSLGGSNSQIYIYVNETKNMQIVRDKPHTYRNRLLNLINSRHEESVKMLSFLFQNNLSSEEIWEHLENYFLGIMPPKLLQKTNQVSQKEDLENISIQFQLGDKLCPDYPDWESASVLFDQEVVKEFEQLGIPMADCYAGKLVIGEIETDAELVWIEKKTAITSGEETNEFRESAKETGWICIPFDEVNSVELKKIIDMR